MNLSTKLNILHLDGCAGLSVGILLFILKDGIGHLYNLPDLTIIFLAAANTCYGIYALSLAFSKSIKLASITLLFFANIV